MAVEIDQEKVKAVFQYLPETGQLVWKRREDMPNAWNAKFVGKVAGGMSGPGYFQVAIYKKRYLVHRLIWVMFNGPIPDDLQVDHINRTRTDNRIENLRLLTCSQNLKNSDRWDKWIETGIWEGFGRDHLASKESREISQPETAIRYVRQAGKLVAMFVVEGRRYTVDERDDPVVVHKAIMAAAKSLKSEASLTDE